VRRPPNVVRLLVVVMTPQRLLAAVGPNGPDISLTGSTIGITLYHDRRPRCRIVVISRHQSLEDTMNPIDRAGTPERSGLFTSALADLDIHIMTALIMDSIRTPTDEEIMSLMEEYADMTVEELRYRSEHIEEYVRTCGASGADAWLTDFLIDRCMTDGDLDIELVMAHAQVLRNSLRGRQHRYRLNAPGGEE
jgi:hypothetical protein